MKTIKVYELQFAAVHEYPAHYAVRSANDIVRVMREEYAGAECVREKFYVVGLDNNNAPLGIQCNSVGGLRACLVDTNLVYKFLVQIGAVGCVLVHNHPTGKLEASHADKQITQQIKRGCETLQIQLLDHIILTPDAHHSMAENGEI